MRGSRAQRSRPIAAKRTRECDSADVLWQKLVDLPDDGRGYFAHGSERNCVSDAVSMQTSP